MSVNHNGNYAKIYEVCGLCDPTISVKSNKITGIYKFIDNVPFIVDKRSLVGSNR